MEENNQEQQNQEQHDQEQQNDELLNQLQIQILDSIPEDLSQTKSFTDRYFTKTCLTDFGGIKNNDLMLLLHSNRIVVLTLAPTHFFFKKEGDYKINFTVGKVDRSRNFVKGKGKKGGQKLMPSSVICKIEYSDGTSFDVQCGLKGTLLEINDDLIEQPELLKTMPDGNGYIAIIISVIPFVERRTSLRLYNIIPN